LKGIARFLKRKGTHQAAAPKGRLLGSGACP
jgi:hypothetical protein